MPHKKTQITKQIDVPLFSAEFIESSMADKHYVDIPGVLLLHCAFGPWRCAFGPTELEPADCLSCGASLGRLFLAACFGFCLTKESRGPDATAGLAAFDF